MTNLGRRKQGEVGDGSWGGAVEFHCKFFESALRIINDLQKQKPQDKWQKIKGRLRERRGKRLWTIEESENFVTSRGAGEVAAPSEFWSAALQIPRHSPGLNATTRPFPTPNTRCTGPPPIRTPLCRCILHWVRDEEGMGARTTGNAANRVAASAMAKTLVISCNSN